MKRGFVRHISESASQRLLLEKGDVDVARNLSPEDIAAVSEKAGIKIAEDLRGRIMYLSLNQKTAHPDDPQDFEAVKLANDSEGMTRHVIPGRATRESSSGRTRG